MRFLLGICLFFSLSAEMTLREEVGQLFLSSVEGDDVVGFLDRTALGNVILYQYANGLEDREQVTGLCSLLREFISARTGVAPLIAIDQEWGRVRQLEFVGTTGAELAPLGINLNLAPVVDFEREGVIGGRSFGSDVETVVEGATAFIEELRPVGCCLKHFPGHGSAVGDSHLELPWTIEDVERHLEPFRRLWPQADAIMTAHITVPELDSERCATLSPVVVGLLRSWGFEGVIVTDSLVMQGVSPLWSVECHAESAISAFQAGCDLLLLQGEMNHVEGVMARFYEAVESGEISRERLQQSVKRILRLKERVA